MNWRHCQQQTPANRQLVWWWSKSTERAAENSSRHGNHFMSMSPQNASHKVHKKQLSQGIQSQFISVEPVIKMMSDISKHSLQTCTRRSVTMHHSFNSHFILSRDNSHIPFLTVQLPLPQTPHIILTQQST